MLKKIPQDNHIKVGDVIFYDGICDFVDHPMIILYMKNDHHIEVRYYDKSNHSHSTSILHIGNFIKVKHHD